MSYDLLIWEGPRPRDTQHLSELRAEFSVYLEQDPAPPPTPLIRAFTQRLDERWNAEQAKIDFAGSHYPFSVLPVGGEGCGPAVMIPIQWEYCEAVAPEVAAIARSMGLVCVDENGMPGEPISNTVDRAMMALGRGNGGKPWWARVLGRG